MSGGPAPVAPSDDRIVSLQLDPRRQRVLASLEARTDPVDLDDLAVELAASTDRPLAEGVIERIAIELHHVHLPKLADAGLVDYDAQRKVVRSVRESDAVAPYLRLARHISALVGSSPE